MVRKKKTPCFFGWEKKYTTYCAVPSLLGADRCAAHLTTHGGPCAVRACIKPAAQESYLCQPHLFELQSLAILPCVPAVLEWLATRHNPQAARLAQLGSKQKTLPGFLSRGATAVLVMFAGVLFWLFCAVAFAAQKRVDAMIGSLLCVVLWVAGVTTVAYHLDTPSSDEEGGEDDF